MADVYLVVCLELMFDDVVVDNRITVAPGRAWDHHLVMRVRLSIADRPSPRLLPHVDVLQVRHLRHAQVTDIA